MASDPRFPGARSQTKKGREYWRIRKDGKDISLPGQPGDPAFEVAYNMAVMGNEQVIVGRTVQGRNGKRLPERTYWHAFLELKKTPEWADHDPKTQGAYENLITEFCDDSVHEDSKLTWAEVIIGADRDEAKALRIYMNGIHAAFKTKAHLVKSIVKKLVDVAVAEEWIEPEQDPTLGVKLKRRKNTPHKVWEMEDRMKFEARWPLGTPARTAYAIALYLGNRRSDIANLRWADLKMRQMKQLDGSFRVMEVFEFRQQKNAKRNDGGTEMQLVIPKQLAEVLAAAERKNDFILWGWKGQKRSLRALSGCMMRWAQLAGLPRGLTLHGLRRTFATILSDNDATNTNVQHAMGHAHPETTAIYLNETNRKRSMVKAGGILEEAIDREKAMTKQGPSTGLRLVSK
jgi:integrase